MTYNFDFWFFYESTKKSYRKKPPVLCYNLRGTKGIQINTMKEDSRLCRDVACDRLIWECKNLEMHGVFPDREQIMTVAHDTGFGSGIFQI
jgi:hypothetical protein